MGAPYGIPSLWTESVSAVTASNSVELGTFRFDGGDIYQYVYNGGGQSAGVGMGLVLSAVSGYTVTVSSVTGVHNLFGVVKNESFTTNTYGWALTRGFTALEMGADNSGIVGLQVILGTDGVFTNKTCATGFTNAACGFITQRATASGGSSFGFIWGM